jgi:hypothetical protein
MVVGHQEFSASFAHAINHASEDELEEDLLLQVMPTTLEEELAPPCLDDVADYFSLAEEYPKTVLSTCPAEVVLMVSNAQRQCKEETWPPGQVAWSVGLTSGPHAPNLRPEYRLTPINTTVLPPTKSVKKVRFSPPQGASKFNICRVERDVWF